jgi:hypothetical protein
MQVTDAVAWTLADFALAGGLLGGAGLGLELAARSGGRRSYRMGVGVALAAAVLLVWATGAVGLIGSEDHPANRLFAVVLLVGLVGALLARFRPQGMAWAMVAAAVAQAVVAGAGLSADWGPAGPVRLGDVAMATGLFGAHWLLAAGLFRRAARTPGGRPA